MSRTSSTSRPPGAQIDQWLAEMLVISGSELVIENRRPVVHAVRAMYHFLIDGRTHAPARWYRCQEIAGHYGLSVGKVRLAAAWLTRYRLIERLKSVDGFQYRIGARQVRRAMPYIERAKGAA